MDGFCGCLCQRRFLFAFIFLSLAHSVVSEDPDYKCSTNRTSLPSTNFDKDFNTWKDIKKGGAWMYSQTDTPVARKDNKDGYIYLDDKKSNEQTRRIQASPGAYTPAVCVDFFHATTGPSDEPIRFYLWDGTQEFLMHEVVPTQEVGTWNKTSFACCLPKLSKAGTFIIEATSHKDAIVAIDYLDVRHSEMDCGDNSRLVCYPTPPTRAPPTVAPTTKAPTTKAPTTILPAKPAQTAQPNVPQTALPPKTTSVPQTALPPKTTSVPQTALPPKTTLVPQTALPGTSFEPTCTGEQEGGVSSCEFSVEEADLENCEWTSMKTDDWDFETKDGERYIYTLDSANENLLSFIAKDLLAVCLEIMFAPANDTEDISDLFKIYLSNETNTILWGASYDYTNDESKIWKINSFDGCIGSGPNRRLTFVSSHAGLKVNYIRSRKSVDPGDVCIYESNVSPPDEPGVVPAPVKPSTASSAGEEIPKVKPTEAAPKATQKPEKQTVSAKTDSEQGTNSNEDTISNQDTNSKTDSKSSNIGSINSNTRSEPAYRSSNVAAIVGGIMSALAIVGLILTGLWWYNRKTEANTGGRYVYNTAGGVESIASAMGGVQNTAYTP